MSNLTDQHEFGASHQEIETTSDRSFGLVFAAVFAHLSAYWAWRHKEWWPYTLALSAVFLVLALTRPALLAPLNKLWTKLGLLLGAIVAPVVMGVVYFAVVTPLGLLARLLGKDFLNLRRDPAAGSYWIVRQDQDTSPERLRDQF
jgi:hypothetical protein